MLPMVTLFPGLCKEDQLRAMECQGWETPVLLKESLLERVIFIIEQSTGWVLGQNDWH